MPVDAAGDDLSALAYSLSRAEELLRSLARRSAAAPRDWGAKRQGEDERPLAPVAAHVTVASGFRDFAKQARSPSALNGQPRFEGSNGLDTVHADRATQLAPMLSPRQLARLAVGFGEGKVRGNALWQSLTKEALTRASAFSAPDVLRVLAGFDAANVQHPGFLKTFWALAAEKQAKYLVEELLALLQLWPRLPPALRVAELPDSLMKHLRGRLEKGSRGVGWYAPAELATELIEWLPASRALTDRGMDGRLVRASMAQLPRQLQSATPALRQRLLAALTLRDEDILTKARSEAQQSEALQRALAKVAQELIPAVRQPAVRKLAADTAFGCAALGFDGPALRDLLGVLLEGMDIEVGPAARICWACAEVGVHASAARALLSRLAAAGATPSAIEEKVSFLRLAWALLAFEGPEAELRQLLALGDADDHDQILEALSPPDLRPMRQLAWHCQQQLPEQSAVWSAAVLADGPHAPRSASAGSHGRPPQTEAEKTLSALLQHLRIPHVVASPAAVPGGIYRIPVWFPEQSAALELEQLGDRLAGGGLSGTARLRRRQLREAGLKVLAFDPSAFRGASQLRRLRAVAEVVAPSCPEAAAWLRSGEAAQARAEDLQRLSSFPTPGRTEELATEEV
ncbi:unnamed protein product [Symbiodinium microadriaticum]|nr:unnamed protein product [Symbiodinium microadriaticum]